MTGTAKPTVFIDNDKVIVTEWRFAPGANTGWHRVVSQFEIAIRKQLN